MTALTVNYSHCAGAANVSSSTVQLEMDPVVSVIPIQGAISANLMEDSVTSFVLDDLEDITCDGGENEHSVPSQILPPSNEPLQQPPCIAHKSLPVVPTYIYNNTDIEQLPLEKPILTVPGRGPVLRSKSFDDALFPKRASELQQRRDPPNTIVFITTMQRQRRRSSICSQITLDEDLDHSNYNDCNGMEGGEDTTTVSLDVGDVFEPKVEHKFHRKEHQNNSSSADSSISTSQSSYCHDSTVKRKRPQETIRRASSFRFPVRKQNSVRTTTMNQLVEHQSSKLNNSAKLRWLQNDDSDSSDASSEYEDFAQDSLKRGTVLRKQNVTATLAEWKLTSEDDDENTNRVPLQRYPEAPPRRNSTGVGRVA
jgi:hypothetical protein